MNMRSAFESISQISDRHLIVEVVADNRASSPGMGDLPAARWAFRAKEFTSMILPLSYIRE